MASSAQHQEIKAALERYTKEELVELMEHLLRIYVLDEPIKLDSALSKPESIRDFSGCSFSQLLSYLQSNLEMEELGKFRVTPYTIYVSVGEAEFDLNGPTPTLAREAAPSEESNEVNEEDMSPAERMGALDNKPWRSAPRPVQAPVSKVETPSMADLFADDSRPSDHTGHTGSGFFFDEAPTKAEDDDDLEAPVIADVAPGDDPEVVPETNDFAKAAASREDAPAAATPATPPPLASGDKQIDPSNRFASLDLD